jgi:mono/diheme cytochrome c family protein
MRTFGRIFLWIVALLTLAVCGGITYMYAAYPRSVPLVDVKIDNSPAAVERGRYLATAVADCVGCHSEVDHSQLPPRVKPGTEWQGGERWDPETADMPGVVYSPNLTPANLGTWSDAELFRAITTGIAKDGHGLFPLMPYPSFGKMDARDITAIIAFLRTLPAKPHASPAPRIQFPINIIARTFPGPATLTARPPESNKVEYGKYLATLADCTGCHTKTDSVGNPSADTFAGGQEMRYPPKGFRVRTANITPDADTGIGSWTEQQFIDKFKGYEAAIDRPVIGPEERQNTIMPWTVFARMTREDLGAIYAYLRTLRPIVNRVSRHPDGD